MQLAARRRGRDDLGWIRADLRYRWRGAVAAAPKGSTFPRGWGDEGWCMHDRSDRLGRGGDDRGLGPLAADGVLRRTYPHVARRERPRRRWDAVSWWYSLILVVPALLLVGDLALDQARASGSAVLRVTDRFSGEPLAGAAVAVGDRTLTSDANGVVRIEAPERGTVPVAVSMAGFEAGAAEIQAGADGAVGVALRPTTLTGTVLDAETAEPLPDAQVLVVTDAGPTQVAATTGPDGTYRLEGVPAGARLRVDGGDWGVFEEPIGDRVSADVRLRRSVVTGIVTDASGAPLDGAVVSAGDARATTGPDGTYRLVGVADGAEVKAVASGFADAQGAIGPGGTTDLRLEPIQIKAIYANQFTLVDPAEVDRLIALIDATELNALVVDVKQDTIYYDSQVPFFRDIEGMVVPLYDPTELLGKLAEHDIYAIARIVVFKDPVVAEARPDLAVGDDVTGKSWRDYDGNAWVNAFHEELWDANIDLALEAAGLGFDEIQWDYVRFPSDGDLTTANFGPDYSQEAREGAITGFVARSSERIRPTGAKLAVDLFAMIALQDNDQGIGQRLKQIAPLVDYVCLMVYPSHYSEGNILSAPGHPNDYPYETVLETLERAEELVPGIGPKQRPWLQDFSHPVEGLAEYGAAEVAAQIQAAEEAGASGWLLWNPANEYQADALDPA